LRRIVRAQGEGKSASSPQLLASREKTGRVKRKCKIVESIEHGA